MTFYGGGRQPFAFDEYAPRSSSSQQHGATTQELQKQLDRQNLMIQTMARLLMAKGVVQEEELNEWFRYVDGLDGAVDGKLRASKAPKACPNCNRMNPPTATRCQYCAAEMNADFLDKTE